MMIQVTQPTQSNLLSQLLESYQQHLGDASSLLRDGHWSAAEVSLRKAIAQQSQVPSWHQLLGLAEALHQQGDVAEALAVVQQVIDGWPGLAWGFAKRGWLRLDLNQPKAAVGDFLAAIEIWPEMPNFYYGLARGQILVGQPVAALSSLKEVLLLEPSYPEAQSLLAQLRTPRDKNHDKNLFVNHHLSSLKSSIHCTQARDNTTQLQEYLQAQDWPAVVTHCQQWLQTDSRSRTAWEGLARGYLEMGKALEGLEAIERAIPLAGASSWALTLKARLLLQLGRKNEALTCSQVGLTAYPDSPSLLQTLAEAQAGLGDLDGAIAIFEQLIVQQPDELNWRWQLLKLLKLKDAIQPALEQIKYLRQYPVSVKQLALVEEPLLQAAAAQALKTGESDAAQISLLRLLERYPSNLWGRQQLHRLLEASLVRRDQGPTPMKSESALSGESSASDRSLLLGKGWFGRIQDFGVEVFARYPGLSLRIDGQVLIALDDQVSDGTHTGEGSRYLKRIPPELCDGRVHCFELVDALDQVVAQQLSYVPWHLTPWPSLVQEVSPPLPDYLNPQATDRYRNWQLWCASNQPLPASLKADSAYLCGDRPDWPEMPFPQPTQPLVSVIIPVHNQLDFTLRSLSAVRSAFSQCTYEVIVVDDQSTDETALRLGAIAGLRLIRTKGERGFVPACNLGASQARGEYLVFLNNDTEVTGGWMDELLAPLIENSQVGITGAKLVYPNGVLQEAGGIVWGNGQPWNYGRNGNSADPRFNYRRQVDYVSGACLMIRKVIWEQVGGFSQEFAPAYYEDTDLAFKVRQVGFQVVYVPLAKVYHFEGQSNGTDAEASQGLKRFQALNAPRFHQRWQQAFQGCCEPSLAAAEREKDRGIVGRALFIDHALPRPDQDAGSWAAQVEMRLVQALGYKVTFIPVNLAWLGRYAEDLQRLGIEVIHAPFVLSVAEFLESRGSEFDLVYVTRYTVAQDQLDLVRRYAPQAKLLFCTADLHFLRELRQHCYQGREADHEQLEQIRADELAVIRAVDLTFSYSDLEAEIIFSETRGQAPVARAPWVVALPPDVPDWQERSGVAFLGSYRHPPNRKAVDYFLSQVWPAVQAKRPDITFRIYGSGLDEETARCWAAQPGVDVVGFVADLGEVYARHRLFVSPLQSGAGIKGKVLNALAYGIPQVLTPIAAEGTSIRDGIEACVCNNPDDWVVTVLDLYDDPVHWRSLSAAGRALASSRYSFEQGRRLMAKALRMLNLPLQEISQEQTR